jgi:hypothetical protein
MLTSRAHAGAELRLYERTQYLHLFLQTKLIKVLLTWLDVVVTAGVEVCTSLLDGC